MKARYYIVQSSELEEMNICILKDQEDIYERLRCALQDHFVLDSVEVHSVENVGDKYDPNLIGKCSSDEHGMFTVELISAQLY